MITVVADHNLEGQAALLFGALSAEGWLDLVPLRLSNLEGLGLPTDSNDRVVWRFVQEHGMVLLTGNRRMQGPDSLEQTIREENREDALPVLTIGDVQAVVEHGYRHRCALRLVEIALELDSYRGTGRLFIP